MKFLTVLACTLLLTAANAHFRIGERTERSDSQIYGPKYQEMILRIKSITDLYSDKVENIKLGKTVAGIDIHGFLFRNKSGLDPNKLIIITGATHGNEYLNLVDRMIVRFTQTPTENFEKFLSTGGSLLMIPIMNPDGYDRRRRRNLNNKDLNRDYPNDQINLKGLTQIETQGIVGWIEDHLKDKTTKLKLVMDYHCCNGSLLYPFAYKRERIPEADLLDHQFIGKMMGRYLAGYIYGITGEVLGYFPKGTTKDYWYLAHNALAFTFEGKRRIEDQNLSEHIAWWDEIFAQF